MALYLVIGEPMESAPPATVAMLEEGVATLSALVEWEKTGKAKFAGIFSGRNGIAFVLDVADHTELHLSVAQLPPFAMLTWQVIPMLSAAEDLEISRGALDRYRAAEANG
jgi:hypothetical protein